RLASLPAAVALEPDALQPVVELADDRELRDLHRRAVGQDVADRGQRDLGVLEVAALGDLPGDERHLVVDDARQRAHRAGHVEGVDDRARGVAREAPVLRQEPGIRLLAPHLLGGGLRVAALAAVVAVLDVAIVVAATTTHGSSLVSWLPGRPVPRAR